MVRPARRRPAVDCGEAVTLMTSNEQIQTKGVKLMIFSAAVAETGLI